MRQKADAITESSLKRPHTDSFAFRHSPWTPMEGQKLGRARDIEDKSELCDFREKAAGTATIFLG